MARVFEVYDAKKRQRYHEDDLPLLLGAAPDNQVRLENVAQIVGQIDLHDGKYLFIQPKPDVAEIYHNNLLITDTAWIKSGDQTRIGDWIIRYTLSGDRVEIVKNRYTGPETIVPGMASSQATPGDASPLPPVTTHPERVATSKKRTLVAGLIFIVLLLAAMFILTARPLEVDISPQPENMTITGRFPLMPIGSRYLGLPGSYLLHAARTGYQQLDKEILLDKNQPTRFSFTLKPLPGSLNVTSIPKAATVLLNNSEIGKTPIEQYEIKVGAHQLRCRKTGYTDVIQTIDITPQQLTHIQCTMEADIGRAFIITDPPGAAVTENDFQLGTTPLTLELPAGRHALVLSRKNFTPETLPLNIEAGKTLTHEIISLHRKSCTLTIDSHPSGAEVLADKKVIGTTPLQIHWPPATTHHLRFSLKGYEQKKQTITLTDKRTQTITVKLRPKKTVQKTSRKKPPTKNNSPEQPAQHTAGATPTQSTRQKIRIKPAMVRLEPGSFLMGSSRRETGRRANEGQHKVTLNRAFLLGQHEVTNAEFHRFQPGHHAGNIGGQNLDADDYPVVKVRWEDAARYCNWLSDQQNLPRYYVQRGNTLVAQTPATKGYRLPFEAEWEYAARKVARTRPGSYPWDGQFPPRHPQGNYADESARTIVPVVIRGYYDGFPVLAPVENFPRNMAGLFDMGGNVAEWCHDFYSPIITPMSGRAVDPTGPKSGKFHVYRGSSWRDGAVTELRISYRGYANTTRDSLGFRIARFE